MSKNPADELRKAIGEYHQTRATTQRAVLGRPDLSSQVAARREESLEQRAATDFRLLAEAALGRSPQPADLESGSALVAIAQSGSPVVRGGTRSLTTLFRFLAQQEREIQDELGLVAAGLGTVALRWGAPTVAVAGLGVLGYYLWKRRRPPMPGEPGAPDVEEAEEAEDVEEQEE